MSDSQERLVFEPGTVPRRRKNTARKVSFKCCLKTTAALGAVVGFVIVILIGRSIIEAVPNLLSSHSDIPTLSIDDNHESTVKPLINTTSPFNILATVWLEVTQHLANGGTLPEEIPVVHYRQKNGFKRSEAILYSDYLFKNATMKSKLHASARIRLPIEPLYSQLLGPSTLRGTFKVIPLSFPTDLTFNTSSSIYPAYMPIGPRSPQSLMLKEGDREQDGNITLPTSLEEALEQSAINTNLLGLLPTIWRLNETEPNLRDDNGVDAPMFDCSYSNRAFRSDRINSSSTEFLTTKDHRILLPHVRTRSRIIMVKEERNLSISAYKQKATNAHLNFWNSCRGIMAIFANNTFDEQCQRPFQDSIFENSMTFISQGGSPRQFYAPFLIQQADSSAYRHHRTIPRFEPKVDTTTTNSNLKTKIGKEDGCLVPLLRLEKSNGFFEFDWDVYFSSHVHVRSILAETLSQYSIPGTLKDFVDDGAEIRVKSHLDESTSWTMQGAGVADREHPNSKPWRVLFQVGILVLLDFTNSILTIIYWYTRTTTQGLSLKGQALSFASRGFQLAEQSEWDPKRRWISFDNLAGSIDILGILLPAMLQLLTLLRLEWDNGRISRRPATKKERDSMRLDSKLGWILPIGLIALHFVLFRYDTFLDVQVLSPQGCQYSKTEMDPNSKLVFPFAIVRQLRLSLLESSGLMQLLFNNSSGTFAGNLKLTTYLIFAKNFFEVAVERLEFLSGWMPSRSATPLSSCIRLLILSGLAIQAYLYPGISQAIAEEDNDDDD